MELNENLRKKLSRFMALVLRHKPQTIGIKLDSDGWCDFETFLQKVQRSSPRWHKLTAENIHTVLEKCNKQRFTIKDGRIRANQGHSNKGVDLQFSEITPQEDLYHGTSRSAWEKIRQSGLLPMQRHHVHLSADLDTAWKVGKRYDKDPVILKIDVPGCQAADIKFFISENDVYLCKHIPPQFIQVFKQN
ncbi:RNA 2'-phosphotransferase [Candidatus Uabimicrobium amorphum]|uniref:Probable RNA 2'-phosphotransferase n=1 Tax=Uabimicrobium amorphum TaxID=2596890 RepID=A0A5S9IQJ2_UABAM|nr:RNA 2'-phosphotransferase [Candidatus Uabimicrobium amorphum]BBM85731.1 putative RNA 2'-phosphotransferase [Candidatus Uabimicrobium amorphum]